MTGTGDAKKTKMTKMTPIYNPRTASVSHHTTSPPVKSRHKVSTTPYASCVDPGRISSRVAEETSALKWNAGAEISISATRDQSKGYWFDPMIARLRILAAPPTRLSGRQPRNRTPAPHCHRFSRRQITFPSSNPEPESQNALIQMASLKNAY